VSEAFAGHEPVLLEETLELLGVAPGDVIVDATVGLGGHARVLGERAGASGVLIGLDVDPENLAVARERLVDCPADVRLHHANFRELRDVLSAENIDRVDVLFADLGVASTHLDQPQRGFSFREDGPLDMRMDPRLAESAADLVNRLKERELSDILFFNAQEMKSRRIAKRICECRKAARITTTGRLAEIVCSALNVNPRSRRSKIHPATRTFQALRIAVNDEIGALTALLDSAPDVLRPGGRFGVIAFHSIEDKPVKLDFRRRKNERTYDIVTKKPVTASERERLENPRSRSAKLRVAVRLGETEPG